MKKRGLRVFTIVLVIVFCSISVSAFANESRLTHLGTPVTSVTIAGAVYGEGPNGEEWIYAVANGHPAKFNVLDAHTGERIAEFPLPDAFASWGLTVVPNGDVYIATVLGGHFFKYTPGSDHVEDLQRPIPGETHYYSITHDDDGNVYGGTYPNGKVVKYNPNTGEYTDFGTILEGVQYVRSIAYGDGKVYAGLGTPAHLFEIDRETMEKREIPLPEEYRADSFVYDLDYEGHMVFARVNPSNTILIYDTEKEEWIKEIPNAIGINVSSIGPQNKVYMRIGMEMSAYDIETNELSGTGVTFPAAPRGLDWVHLESEDFPGPTLLGINSRGLLGFYNPATGNSKFIPGNVLGEPNTIQSLAQGPDGNIYVGGYLSPQGMGVYDPDSGELRQLPGISQIEGMGVHDGKLYMGVYPGARIFEYDPTQAWYYGNNPQEIFSLEGEKQDRPFAFASVGDRIAIGTVAEYGHLDGTLTFYDPNTENVEVFHQVVEDQSIIELVYRDGYLYGSTTIWGGYGIDPTASEAKLFIWDVARNEKVWEGAPLPGESAISALTFDDQGYLWGLSAGKLFKFDPDTRETVLRTELFSYDGGDARYYTGRDLAFDSNGYLYGSSLNRIFRVDPNTLNANVLVAGASLMAQDKYGDIYFVRDSTELYKYDKMDPISVVEMQELIVRFEDEGQFENEGAAHALKLHLTAVGHFVQQEDASKVVKHMNGFILLLEHQKDNGSISEKAYKELMKDTDMLIKQWQ